MRQRGLGKGQKLWESDQENIYGKLMEAKGYFSRLVCIDSYPDSSNENVLPLLVQRWFLSHRKFYDLFFGRKVEVREVFLHLLFIRCFQFQSYTQMVQLGVARQFSVLSTALSRAWVGKPWLMGQISMAPVFVNKFYWDTAKPTHLHIVYGSCALRES